MKRPTGRERFDIRGFFDGEASRYLRERYLSPTCDQFAYQTRKRLALELLGGGPGRVLDIGAGPGVMTADLCARGYEVYALDASLEMLRESQHRMGAGPGKVHLIEGCLPDLPFGSETFDAALCVGVLAYLDNPIVGLREIRRVVRPGGVVILQVSNALCPTGRLHSVLRRWYRRAGEAFGRPAYPHLEIRLRQFRPGPLWRSLESVALRPDVVAFYDFRPPLLQWIMPKTALAATRWFQRFEYSKSVRCLAEGIILKVRAC
jgi:ubiquinone/menaquinone biosynthesis C-methylase UbiE